MTEQEALAAALYRSSGLDQLHPNDAFGAGFHAALAWLRSQGDPVAWRVVTREGVTRCILEREPLREQFDLGETFVPLFLAPQPAIPDGYLLVPVEPTQEMIGAFADVVVGEAAWQESSDEERAETTAGFVPAYSAMLAAAPEPNK